jgi:hypothetical protein
MNDEFEGFVRKRWWPNRGIILEGMRKTTKNCMQVSRCPGLLSNQAPPEYISTVLPLDEPVRVIVLYCHWE